MNVYGAKDLAAAFRTVRANTLTIAGEIGEDKYGFSPAAGARTVAQTLVHMAVVSRVPLEIHGKLKLSNLAGFDFMAFFVGLLAEEQTPRTKDQIIALLTEEGDKFAGWLETLTDEFLAEQVSFPAPMTPPVKSRFEILMSVKEHEMDHRGQLMVIERMLGITPHLTRRMQEFIAQYQASKASA